MKTTLKPWKSSHIAYIAESIERFARVRELRFLATLPAPKIVYSVKEVVE